MEGREHDLDRSAGRVTVRAIGRRDVSAGQLGHSERPAHEPETLDERRGRTDHHGQDAEGRRCAEDDGEAAEGEAFHDVRIYRNPATNFISY